MSKIVVKEYLQYPNILAVSGQAKDLFFQLFYQRKKKNR